MTTSFGSRSRRPWQTLNCDHHQCPSLLYVPHEQSLHGVFRQDSCHHHLVTYLSTRRQNKNRWAGQGTSEDRHVLEEELHQPPSSRSILPHQRPCVSTSHSSLRDQAFPWQGDPHQDSSAPFEITPRFNNPLWDHYEMKRRQLPAGVATWVTWCAQGFPCITTPEVFPTS